MKIIIIIICAIFSKIGTKTVLLTSGIFANDCYKSQSYNSANNPGFGTYSIFQQTSPTNLYTNRRNCITFDKDSTIHTTKYIYLDSLWYNNFAMESGAKFLWMKDRRLRISSVDSMVLSSRQVTAALGFVPSVGGSGVASFNSRSGSVTMLNTDVYSALTYTPYNASNPSGYITGITSGNVTSALGYTPYNSTNPNGYISNYNETDPIWNTDKSNYYTKTQSDAMYKAITYTPTTSQVTTAIGYIPLQSEVDGSVSNELQTLSISGQSLSLTSGNTIVIPTQTTALTSPQVTTALGYIPVNTISINSDNLYMSVSGTSPNFTLTPYISTPNAATRPINSNTFQISVSKQSFVVYTIRINCVATIGGAASGTVNLQYSINNGSSWVDVSQVENSNTVTLAVVLNSNTTQTGVISGVIPAGAIVRMNQTISGSTTITYVRGQETY